MILLSGAEITIRYMEDQGRAFYMASVYVGTTSTYAHDKDPIRAIGKAITKQAGYTEGKLRKELLPHEPK